MILAVPSIGFSVGQMLVLLVGLIAMQSEIECENDCGWWRWVFGAGLIPDTIAFLFFLTLVPESPRYLLLHGKADEAEAVIRQIAVANGTEDRLLNGGRVRKLRLDGARPSLLELIQPPLLKDMLVISVVWTLFGFGLYGFNFLAPILLEVVYHVNSHEQFCLLLVMVLVEATGVVLVMMAVDLGTLGRLVFLLGLALTAVPLLLIAAVSLGHSLVIFGVSAVLGKACANAAYQSFYIYAAERLPTSHRAAGVGIANSVSKTAAVAAPVAFVALLRLVPEAVSLLALATALAAGATVLAVGSTETMGRALGDYPDQPAPMTAEELPTEETPLLC